ncbi:LysR family transcriptional regulator [Legionella bononiensis]|uniref:LysR family transcriptional regulator n=1 Tax=Legionella bononiensis TaxID=2793102 RepID=A0ABS1W711_9GAMM|nr:LysR family transcriptional regulator [Legionella bononiensis]MBL7481247.1 LysR family transcriptional regulator [Legionella bononiensis]MBL7525153.1 LysR family transcriptional regulator [Legionella bononiensis]MBL7562877.1 LysR family transcriptional regulator [Legionella bononiensis]
MLASPTELYYFNEVCHTLNFSRASERLGISQPSLSQAIKRLETFIGTPLFLRVKTGVKLTKAGCQLHSHTKELLTLWERVKSESLASCQEVQGSITLGCHSTVARHILPTLLPDFVADYPHLEIALIHDLSRKIVEGVINMSIDVGIVVNPVQHPGIVLKKLYRDEVGFWQANDYQWSFEQGGTIICDPELMQTQQVLSTLREQGRSNYRLLTSSNLDVIASLVANGTGIGILPYSVVKTVRSALKAVPEMPSYQDEIYLAYRPEQRDIMALKELIKAIKNTVKLLHADDLQTSS